VKPVIVGISVVCTCVLIVDNVVDEVALVAELVTSVTVVVVSV